ncbi:hypothetical protein AVEN_109410-1 [Araneus ventricosus]|uniref:Uncharacterized protein n=1 Tax=Araneus ventricosus TaxID=182803 RepID=A0A4Y2PS47_ARAVE|nr:hypothetical protein AVEN_109410-1 [Araneus ventricosus]
MDHTLHIVRSILDNMLITALEGLQGWNTTKIDLGLQITPQGKSHEEVLQLCSPNGRAATGPHQDRPWTSNNPTRKAT